uniref:Uncharacterized protein n=1 Tax=Cacopsylla melanoneura TaxID=428564 RepID=A0A8D8VKX7_9HEMI
MAYDSFAIKYSIFGALYTLLKPCYSHLVLAHTLYVYYCWTNHREDFFVTNNENQSFFSSLILTSHISPIAALSCRPSRLFPAAARVRPGGGQRDPIPVPPVRPILPTQDTLLSSSETRMF